MSVFKWTSSSAFPLWKTKEGTENAQHNAHLRTRKTGSRVIVAATETYYQYSEYILNSALEKSTGLPTLSVLTDLSHGRHVDSPSQEKRKSGKCRRRRQLDFLRFSWEQRRHFRLPWPGCLMECVSVTPEGGKSTRRPSSQTCSWRLLLTQLMGRVKPTVYSTVEVIVLWWKGYLMLSSLQKKPLW